MHVPSKIIDISIPFDDVTVADPPIMRPEIAYTSNKEGAGQVCLMFPGLKPADLPDSEGWAIETVRLSTHNGTHMDAPYHFHSHDRQGRRMMTIDEVPLDWFFRPGVKLDFRELPRRACRRRPPRWRRSSPASGMSCSPSTSSW